MTKESKTRWKPVQRHFDALILGSGFGGTLLATILAQQGYRVAVIDRSVHPRFAIGESSTPSADLILRDLCQKYRIEELAPLARYGTWKETFPRLNCGRKRGFSYFHHSPGKPFQTDDANRNQLLVAASSDDWLCDMHWYRADVDQLFAANAQQRGVLLIENATVRKMTHDKSGWTIEYAGQGQGSGRLRGRFVIDASGQSQLLLNHLGIGDQTQDLRTNSHAVYTHMHGVASWSDFVGSRCTSHPFNCDAAAQHHLLDEGWLWLLRFDDGTTSVGLCLDGNNAEANATECEQADSQPADEFWKVLRRYPDLAKLFNNATLSKTPGRWYRTGRLQRLRTQAAGRYWTALPHSVGFIDPLHSTGIALTMFAIEQIAAAFDPQKKESQRRQELNDYSDGLIATFQWIDQLVWACYRSRGDADLFHAAVMLYFTAVVHYERSRQNDRRRAFLSADWQTLRDIGDQVVAQLGEGSARAQAIVDQLTPLTNVGLGDPSAQRMYRHTNCDVS
jgi:FADH2 O2-dependent halogenase